MQNRSLRPNMAMVLVAFTVLFGVMLACVRALQPEDAFDWVIPGGGAQLEVGSDPGQQGSLAPTALPGGPIITPTPDPPHQLPAMRVDPEVYVVQAGESLGQIAQRFSVSLQALIEENQLTNPDLLEVGQSLVIPVPMPESAGPSFKIIPDSELVYGPGIVGFDIDAYVQGMGGYLAQYQEEVDGVTLTGPEIVRKVAQNYSVNPRLLLAVLQYQSHWLTEASPQAGTLEDPLGLNQPARTTLYPQLAWAANSLNRGYYLWRVNGVASWLLADGSVVPVSPVINAGTAAVQHFFAQLYNQQDWLKVVSEGGFILTYTELFGYPFNLAIEPLLPPDLTQPALQLPFEQGKAWAFTGGPHGGWDSGSAWAALDFAPPSDALGCVQSDEWVVASADGLILRAGEGAVIQDLDGDGYEQTGWVILYMHIETRDRVTPNTYLRAGERIGHPSCEGGVSNGTHVHIARRYNGEWIPADQDLPFVLDGWISSGLGSEYDGIMERDGQTIEAWAGRSPDNALQR